MKYHILLLLCLLLPIMSLFVPGLPVTHDGPDHVARVSSFYHSLSEGILIPRWAGNLNWGYGHPILMFLYPLPSYFASLFHAVGLSLVDSVKVVFGISYIASGLLMYVWLREKWGTVPGFVGGLLYGFAPYRFVDMYVRGAIGEHVAFVFPPLMLLGIERIAMKRSWGMQLAILGTAGLILSHNAVSLMFLPIFAIYALYTGAICAIEKKEYFRTVFVSLFLGFGVASFFWIPAFFEGKYTLRDIVTKGEFVDRFVPVSWFIYSPWRFGGGNEFTKQLGVGAWIIIAISIWITIRTNVSRERRYIGILLLGVLGLVWMMTSGSAEIWRTVVILQKFQFPWRLLTMTTLLLAILGAYVAHLIKGRYQQLLAGVLLVLSVSTVTMWKPVSTVLKNDREYEGIYKGTTDTGESSPIWSVRFMEQMPDSEISVISGNALTKTVAPRRSTLHAYSVAADGPARLVENTLYFPGWKVYVDGVSTPIEFQDPMYRGRMTFWVDEGVHTVQLKFESTKVRMLADIISAASIGLFVFFSVRKRTHYL